jgi:tetratricopeptide (TPR) repeat protein
VQFKIRHATEGIKLNIPNLLRLALTQLEAGNTNEAVDICQSILRQQPDNSDTLNFLGVVAHQTGRQKVAIEYLENAIRLDDGIPEYYNNCGEAYRALHEYDLAIARFGQAITIKPDYVAAHNNLGNALQEQGRLDESVDCYQRALAIWPDYPEAHNNLAAVYQEQGRIEEAVVSYERALVLKPDYANAWRHLATLSPKQEQAPIIEKLLKKPSIADDEAIHLHYALGNIYDANELHEQAFENYHKANALTRKALDYDPTAHAAYIDSLIDTYTAQYFKEKIGYGIDSMVPVFVVGMPRSGTTLVEQIISCHPQIHGAGELSLISNCERAIANRTDLPSAYPESMRLITSSGVHDLADQYLGYLATFSRSQVRIVDKMPDNFLRLGLIRTLFPNARVIHCRRNARDTCLSVYFQYFQTANEYAFDLEELGRYYLDYERLMRHWRSVNLPGILEIQYEDLVTNQEVVSKQLIEHLELDWDSRCLDFHKNMRPVRTSSVVQVRQPMYTDSIGKWKKYENHLGPLTSILAESSH